MCASGPKNLAYFFSRSNTVNGDDCPDYIERNPAWALDPRRESEVVEHVSLAWDVPLRDLQMAVQGAEGTLVRLVQQKGRKVWQGREMALELIIQGVPISSNEVYIQVGVVSDWSLGGVGSAGRTNMTGEARFQRASEAVQVRDTMDVTPESGVAGIREVRREAAEGIVTQEGGASRFNWLQMNGMLQRDGYVHEDGCLHLRAEIAELG